MNTKPPLFNRIRLTVLLAPILLAACSNDGPTGRDDDGGPGTGAVEAATATTGRDVDPNGYAVSVDGGSEEAIGVNATVMVSGLAPGEHELELTGVAENCTVTGSNPRIVAVTAGGTARTTFAVACVAMRGTLEVLVATPSIPLRGVTVIATGPGGPLSGITGDDGKVQFANVPSGMFTLAARVGGGPCTPQTATLRAGQTTNVTVTCEPGTVRGQVTVNGQGEPDVIVGIFTVSTTTGPDGTYEFAPFGPLDPGYYVAVVPPPGATCPNNFQPLVVPPGGTATVNFVCTR